MSRQFANWYKVVPRGGLLWYDKNMDKSIKTDYEITLEKCSDFYQAWTGCECDPEIAELLADGALRYYEACREGRFGAATLSLESTLTYVNTEMTEEEYEEYVDTFEDYLADCD